MNLPTTFTDKLFSVQAASLSEIGQESLNFLRNQGFNIKLGAQAGMQNALMQLSLEPAIREYCPNDYSQRFGSPGLFEAWLKKGRILFTLYESNQIVGYGWAGAALSEMVKDGQSTFAIRMAAAASGKGLASHFARIVVEASHGLYDINNIWLETWQSNAGAVHIYHKIGFVDVANEPGKRKSTNGSEVDDVRLFMSLPNSALP